MLFDPLTDPVWVTQLIFMKAESFNQATRAVNSSWFFFPDMQTPLQNLKPFEITFPEQFNTKCLHVVFRNHQFVQKENYEASLNTFNAELAFTEQF